MTAPGLGHSEESGRPLVRQPQIWGAVPRRNPDFVGREELLEQLRTRLNEPDGAIGVLPEALHGMSGVGKSQTVVEYIYRHAHEYDIVWWIPSEHPTLIRSSFVNLAKRLGIKASSAETAVPAVLETLRSGVQNRRWILVFDNAEHPDVVQGFLPTGLGHVVVTSRNAEWADVARTFEVDLFTRDESIELLRRRGRGNIADADADRLADALGDLPLAVEQAASWRAQTGMRVDEYIDQLEKNSAELLKAGATSKYELPVAAAWNVPLNRLKTNWRGALELLQLCAFFGPEPISRSLLIGVPHAPVPEALAQAFADPIKLNQAIREINYYSLAKIDHSRDTIQLHRLVQAVLRDQLDHSMWDNMRHTVHLMLANGDRGIPENNANWPLYADLLPHAINSRAFDCQDDRVRMLVKDLVSYLVSTGDNDEAMNLAKRAGLSHEATRPPEVIQRVPVFHANGLAPADDELTPLMGFGIDIIGYGRRSVPAQKDAQERLLIGAQKVLDDIRVQLDELPYTAREGDCIYLFLPAATDPARVLPTLLRAITKWLGDDNDRYKDQIQVRMAIGFGLVGPGPLGLSGPLITDLSRLMDNPSIRQAALDFAGSHVVALVSNGLFKMVRPSERFLAEFPFSRIHVEKKEYADPAWLWTSPHRNLT